jgi:acyl CoA:acetate/3-ketoacid CoA transferase alpha subunit
MREKLVSLEQAAKIVRDGDRIIFNGDMEWTPMALLRELVRNSKPGARHWLFDI